MNPKVAYILNTTMYYYSDLSFQAHGEQKNMSTLLEPLKLQFLLWISLENQLLKRCNLTKS